MSIITAFFASKIAVGLAAASLVTVGGTVAVTTAISDPPATESTSQTAPESSSVDGDSVAEPSSDTTTATDDATSEDATGTSEAEAASTDGSANRQGSTNSAFGLCTAFVNGGLSANSVAYTNLENFATASGSANVNVNGSVDPSAFCDAVIGVKKTIEERVESTTGSEKSAEAQLKVGTRP